jgi:hypothetical protein
MHPASPPSTIPGLTGKGTEVAVVSIKIQRGPGKLTKVLDPPPDKPVAMSFVHQDPQHGGPPTHALPHGIQWEVEGLLDGERVEIQLDTRFPGYAKKPSYTKQIPWWDHLKRLFPNAETLPSGAFGFELTHDAASAFSGRAVLTRRFELAEDKDKKRPLLSYNIVFFTGDQAQVLDPDVDVTPDP